MSIRFYTSDVEPSKTVGEIQHILAEAGARRVAVTYDEGGEVTIEFQLEIAGRMTSFRLAPEVENMHRALQDDEDATGKRQTYDQAERTSWRLLKEWLQMQLAFDAADQASLDQLLLGYGITPSGETIYERLVDEHRLLETDAKTTG